MVKIVRVFWLNINIDWTLNIYNDVLIANDDDSNDDNDDDGLGSSVDIPTDKRMRLEFDGGRFASAGGEMSLGNQKDFEDHNCAFFRLPVSFKSFIDLKF